MSHMITKKQWRIDIMGEISGNPIFPPRKAAKTQHILELGLALTLSSTLTLILTLTLNFNFIPKF